MYCRCTASLLPDDRPVVFQLSLYCHRTAVVLLPMYCRTADPWKAAGQGSSGLCCVWATPRVPSTAAARRAFGDHRFLMHVRMRIATRALRLR